MDFARLGAHKAATPSLCARVGRKAFFLCCVRRAGVADWGEEGLREEGKGGGGGLHVLAPGVGCLCQGHGGDVLAQVRGKTIVLQSGDRKLSLFVCWGLGVGLAADPSLDDTDHTHRVVCTHSHTHTQVSSLRREAERYLAVFRHPISARALALRAAESLQGKGACVCVHAVVWVSRDRVMNRGKGHV